MSRAIDVEALALSRSSDAFLRQAPAAPLGWIAGLPGRLPFMIPTSDLHIVETRPLVPPAVLHAELPITETAARTVQCARERIKAILHAGDQRLHQAGISGAHLANRGFIKRARCAASTVEEGTLLDVAQIVLK
jgi:hypothetical protein